MADSQAERVWRHLHHLLGSSGGVPSDDGQLLQRFVSKRDEDAFAELVTRHGPLVFGLCRRVLRDVHDAEDVFQATFLVLARKAAAIRKPQSLSCWLHGVAYRLAVKAKAEADKRRAHEREAVSPRESAEVDLPWREVRALIDEELQRLPEKQRLPLALCYLEGLTQDEAAQRLNWPRGTLKRRLERGRDRLRLRLTRRGVTLGAGLFAVALTESATKGAVPTALRTATVQASLPFAAGTTAEIAATRAVLLAKGGLQTMMMTKAKIAAMLILMLTCAAAAAGLISRPAPVEKKPEPKTDAAPPPRVEAKRDRTDRHGDALPTAALARLGTVRLRHAGGISPVVFTPDGKTAIVGEQEGDLVYWDVASGREVQRQPRAVPNWPCHLAINADGKILAAVDRVNALFLFETATGKLLSRSEVPAIGPICFAPDGQTLAIRGSKSIVVWDLVHKKTRHELKGHPSYARCMAFNPDGKTLASSAENDPHIRLWDVAVGKEKLRIDLDKGSGYSLAFSPNGKTLAAIDSASWHLSFYDVNSGKKLRTSKDDYFGVSPIQYAPDARRWPPSTTARFALWTGSAAGASARSRGRRNR